MAGTMLGAGDVVVVGWRSSNASGTTQQDGFALLLLKTITAGTTIYATDNGWLAAGGFRNTETATRFVFDNNPTALTPAAPTYWNAGDPNAASAYLQAGTLLFFNGGNATLSPQTSLQLADGTAVATITNMGTGSGFGGTQTSLAQGTAGTGFSTSGDQLTLFQTLDGTDVGGANGSNIRAITTAYWRIGGSGFDAGATGSNDTGLPTGLTADSTAFSYSGSPTINAVLAVGLDGMTPTEARTTIGSTSNLMLDGTGGSIAADLRAGALAGINGFQIRLVLGDPGDNAAQTLLGGLGGDTLTGGNGHDTLRGLDGADSLTGHAGNDLLQGGAGSDALSGGTGLDTAWFGGNIAAHTLTRGATGGWTIAGEGTDTLASVERARFADGTVALEMARTEDLGGRGFGDVLWQEAATGALYRWALEGTTRLAEGAIGAGGPGWSIAGKGDLDGDGRTDLLWRHTDGRLYAWLMDGNAVASQGSLPELGPQQQVAGVADMDGDGKSDLVLRGADGSWTVRRMDGLTTVASEGGTLAAPWKIAAVADLDGNLRADLLWRNADTGQVYAWLMNGAAVVAQGSYATPGADWEVAATTDLTADGRADVVLRKTGDGWIWGLIGGPDGLSVAGQGWIGAEGNGWAFARAADYSGDDKGDLLFTDAASGAAWLWTMDGTTIATSQAAGVAGNGWVVA